jgi:hypothetical protein
MLRWRMTETVGRLQMNSIGYSAGVSGTVPKQANELAVLSMTLQFSIASFGSTFYDKAANQDHPTCHRRQPLEHCPVLAALA